MICADVLSLLRGERRDDSAVVSPSKLESRLIGGNVGEDEALQGGDKSGGERRNDGRTEDER